MSQISLRIKTADVCRVFGIAPSQLHSLEWAGKLPRRPWGKFTPEYFHKLIEWHEHARGEIPRAAALFIKEIWPRFQALQHQRSINRRDLPNRATMILLIIVLFAPLAGASWGPFENWCNNPGFEAVTGTTPDCWTATEPLTVDETNQRSGERCGCVSATVETYIYSQSVRIHANAWGLSSGIYIKHDTGEPLPVVLCLEAGRLDENAVFYALDTFMQAEQIPPGEYVRLQIDKLIQQIDPDATRARIAIFHTGTGTAGAVYMDDAHIMNFNPFPVTNDGLRRFLNWLVHHGR